MSYEGEVAKHQMKIPYIIGRDAEQLMVRKAVEFQGIPINLGRPLLIQKITFNAGVSTSRNV